MLKKGLSTSLGSFVVALLHYQTALAAPPTDAEVNRFLVAYPAVDMIASGWNTGFRRLAESDPASAKRANCFADGFDRVAISEAVTAIVHEEFKDSASLNAISDALDTPGGRKAMVGLQRTNTPKVDENGRSVGPTLSDQIGLSPADKKELLAFYKSPFFGEFQAFAQSVGPRIQSHSAYQRMMSSLQQACRK